jgi:hypothetical protein
MLFAPAELNPYWWYSIVSQRLWEDAVFTATLGSYEEWAKKQRETPGLLEAYRKYRRLRDLYL